MDADQELLLVFRAEVEDQIEDLCERLSRDPKRWKIDRLFQISHNVKGAARLVGVESVREAAHALEDLFSAVRAGLELDDDVTGLARAGSELLDECFRSMDSGDAPDVAGFRQRVSGVVGVDEASADVDAADPDSAVEPAPAPGMPARETVPVPDEPASPGEPAEQPKRDQGAQTLRISADKLDALMGSATELAGHVVESEGHSRMAKELRAKLSLALRTDPALRANNTLREATRVVQDLARSLTEHAADGLRVSGELQSSTRALRMVRIEGLKTLLSQSLRDACRSAGRMARLRLTGADTEIDRGVLEALRDPLVHLIRNAVAHGVEAPEERVAKGKDEAGVVEVAASSRGPWVELAVSDDGVGIDTERVRTRAIAGNAVTAQEADNLGDEGVLDLLFLPGMSTAEAVTNLAGRGVGLDVVRTHVTKLGGEVSIASKPGEGTRVTLLVPLTRLTTTGITVRLGDQAFAIPTSNVERALPVPRQEVADADGTQAISVNGDLVRLTHLATVLGCPSNDGEIKPAVIVRDGSRRRAVVVDEVMGEREYLAQPLPWNLRDTRLVSGSAVIDGSQVVLVLEGRSLVAAAGRDDVWENENQVRQRSVLVVDDSATSRTLECNILKTAGYQVVSAIDGQEALELLQEHEVDLVVSDVEMPAIDGFELTRLIRTRPELEHLPVILVTSRGAEEDRQRGAEAGADAYIVKGEFDQEQLLSTVGRLL